MRKELEMSRKIKVGSKVKYSARFLRSIGAYSGSLPFAKGKVTDLKKFGENFLAEIDWKDKDIPEKVLVSNLIKVGTLEAD